MLGTIDPRPLNLVIPIKQARALHKHLGIESCGDLLRHYPRKYLHYGAGSELEGTREGDTISIIGRVIDTHFIPREGKPIYKITVDDGRYRIGATFFGSRFAMRALTEGKRVMLTGKLSFFRSAPQLQHPDFVLLDGPTQATGALKQLSHFGDLEEILSGREWLPLYPATSKVSTWTIMGAVHAVLKTLPKVEEPLGFTPIGFSSLNKAIREIHEPGPAGPDAARRRLKYEEASGIALVMAVRRADRLLEDATALPPVRGGQFDQLLGNLPFPLTDGQKQVLADITADMSRPRPMSRLLQGEVGSGKTIVSLLAMLQAVDNGSQCALLAPTEVLTMQHARSLQETALRAGLTTSVVALTLSLIHISEPTRPY